MASLDDLFSQVEDDPIPGGCERCDAYQTFESPMPGVHIVNVHHDDWCPILLNAESN